MYGLIQKHKGIAAGIIAIASISFLFWMFSVQDIRQMFGDQRCVAKVEDSCITPREFRKELLKYSDLLNNKEAAPFIKRQIISLMVNRELVYLKAKELGIIVSDREVSEEILNQEIFKVNGKFDYNRYVELLDRMNLTPVEYEEDVKKSLTVNKFVNFVGYGAYLTDKELEVDKKLKSVKVKGKLVIVTPQDVKLSYKPSEKEIKEYYEKNKSRFMTLQKKLFRVWEIEDKKKAHKLYNDLKSGKEEGGFREIFLSQGKLSEKLPKAVESSLKVLSEEDRISIVKVGNTYYVIQFYKTLKPRQKQLEEVKREISDILISLKKKEKLSEYAEKVKKELSKGKTPKAKSISFDNTPLEQIISFVVMEEKDIVELVFGKKRIFGPYMVKDGMAIVLIEDRKEENIKEEDLKAVEEEIKNSKVQALVNLYAQQILKNAEVKINEEYLK